MKRTVLSVVALLFALAISLPSSAQMVGGSSLYSVVMEKSAKKSKAEVKSPAAQSPTKFPINVNLSDFAQEVEIVQQVAVEEVVVEDDQPFVKVEQMPSFMGGDLMTFRNWAMSKVRYPQVALENNITGRVLLSFVIEKDGSLTNIQVLQTPDKSLSDEAVRVLKGSPRWTPGMQRGQAVRVKYTLPLEFRLQL